MQRSITQPFCLLVFSKSPKRLDLISQTSSKFNCFLLTVAQYNSLESGSGEILPPPGLSSGSLHRVKPGPSGLAGRHADEVLPGFRPGSLPPSHRRPEQGAQPPHSRAQQRNTWTRNQARALSIPRLHPDAQIAATKCLQEGCNGSRGQGHLLAKQDPSGCRTHQALNGCFQEVTLTVCQQQGPWIPSSRLSP